MIYFIRHGESVANAKGLFAGQRDDSPLTSKGQLQARQAAADFINKGIKVDRIVTSPLLRTKETAAIVAADIELELADIFIDPRLLEYDMGDFSGTPIRGISSAELTAHPEAEDPLEFQQRVMSALKELDAHALKTLVVSHAGVGRIIEATKQGIDLRHFYDIEGYPNAQVITLML